MYVAKNIAEYAAVQTGKKNTNQAYSCPRDWHFSPIMGDQLMRTTPETPRTHPPAQS